MHDVRKAAKRLRYALETVQPVWAEAKTLHKKVKTITQVLGEHHDTVIARQDLVTIAAAAAAGGENAVTYGRLHHREEDLAGERERDFEHAWHAASRTHLRAWLD
jgi:CHAD domain-containing protein